MGLVEQVHVKLPSSMCGDLLALQATVVMKLSFGSCSQECLISGLRDVRSILSPRRYRQL